MTYTFETLPSRSPSFHAEKILHNGIQVGVLLHLRANDQCDWRVLRLIDDDLITPWDITSSQSLEKAKAQVQAIDPELFSEKFAKCWAVVSNTAYGNVIYLHHDQDGYETQSKQISLMTYDRAAKLFQWVGEKGEKPVVGCMAGGDYIIDVAVVSYAVDARPFFHKDL